MAEISINRDDVKRLGIKLMDLQHKLTPNERTILWGALAIAVDALSRSGPGAGRTALVEEVEGDGNPSVSVDDTDAWRDRSDLDPDFPEMLARAFHPETHSPGSDERTAGGDPTSSDEGIKIGGLVSWKISSGPPRG
jgi:hypothetical protein